MPCLQELISYADEIALYLLLGDLCTVSELTSLSPLSLADRRDTRDKWSLARYWTDSGGTATYKLMNRPIRIQHPLLKIVNNALIDLPSPSNIRTR